MRIVKIIIFIFLIVPIGKNYKDWNYILSQEKISYYEFAPQVIYKPEIIFPDSLLNDKEKIKIFVRVTVDSTGATKNPKIIRSTNKKLNSLAKEYALKYKFDIKPRKKAFVTIPIIFDKTKER